MIIGFCGASGRTDASHCALLAARTILMENASIALLVVGRGTIAARGSIRTIQLAEDVDDPATALRSALATDAARGSMIVADLPRRWLERVDVRSVIDIAIVVVGPHRLDECAAAAMAPLMDAPPAPWYLACRRGGGAPAAARLAATMAELAPGARTLPASMPPLGRADAVALERSAPSGRAYRSGLDLMAAIREVAGDPREGFPEHSRAAATVASSEVPSLADRLRDLADDVEAAEAGLPPDPARLAEAPILDAWSVAAIPVPVLTGRVTGHPNVADGRHARTTEVFLTDRATHARTLSRWYRLRAPAGAAAPGLQ